MAEERRAKQSDILSDIGYVRGKVEGMADKLDDFIDSVKVKHNEQDIKITANSAKVDAVTKKVDRFTWVGSAISAIAIFFITQWHKFAEFWRSVFGDSA